MDPKQLWKAATETMYAFGPFYQDAMSAAIRETGAPDEWFLLSHARGADPQPLSLVRITEINPYTAPQRHLDNLTRLTELDLLETTNGEAYRLTDQGRKAIAGIFRAAQKSLNVPLPTSDQSLNQMADLLERVVQAALADAEMNAKWTLRYSRWTDPGEGGAPASRVDQYLTDLSRFRDDAHLAAWTPHLVSGPAWETLTFLWQEGINSSAVLAERLPYRDHDETVYQEAFETLAAKGWVAPAAQEGTYQLTELGREVRETAEAETDRLFFAPWAVLSEPERNLLARLFEETTHQLKQAAYQKIWALAGEAARTIFTSTRSAVEPIAEKYDLHARGHLFTLTIAHSYHPDPVTAARVRTRLPYSHPGALEAVLSALATRGALAANNSGGYSLTEKGLAILDELFETFYSTLDEIETVKLANLSDLEDLLARLAKASLEAGRPETKAVIELSRRSRPKGEYGPLACIDQHLDDLNAFRDDTHLAAWAPYHLPPETWDAFTQIWAGKADNLEGLMERLQFRGYNATAYAAGLANLVSRGWLKGKGKRYEMTEAGQTLRDEVEEKTNQLFFGPWAALNSLELNRLRYRLQQLIDALAETEPEPASVA